MRKIFFADHFEKEFAEALNDANIEFIHESESKEQNLDFYLPKFDTYIELKQFYAKRIGRQMSGQNNVIALQGKEAINFFISHIKKNTVMNTEKEKTDLKLAELKEAAEPLIKYIAENHGPHTNAVVTNCTVTILEGILMAVETKYIKD